MRLAAASVLFALLLFRCSLPKNDNAGFNAHTQFPLSSSYRLLVKELRGISNGFAIPDDAVFYRILDSLSASLRVECSPDARTLLMCRRMLDAVYEDWKITFDSDGYDLAGHLPHVIVQRGKGSCAGVSLLLMMIGERSGLPLYGSLLPGHLYLRYNDGAAVFNIEPNRNGFAHPDSYYQKRYQPPAGAGYYMRELTPRETYGVFLYNIGNFFLERENSKEAVRYLEQSVSLIPSFAEAWGNLAIVYESLGKTDRARKSFARAKESNPALTGLYAKWGALENYHKQPQNALEVYREGIAQHPGSADLLFGVASASLRTGRADTALAYLARAKKYESSMRLDSLQSQIHRELGITDGE